MVRTQLLILFSFVMLSTTAIAKEWYVGGTLGNASVSRWRAGSPENQLATAADWVTKVVVVSGLSDIKSKALAVRSCVNSATIDPTTHNQPASDFAVLCIVQLNYETK